MKILAIETSGIPGSVALLEEERLLEERTLETGLRTTQTLTPAIDALLRGAGWTPQNLELVAVARGPGSFTGLRIGVTTAKTLGFATPAQLVGVDTLEALAQQTTPDERPLWVVMNAERDQVFAAQFRWRDTHWEVESATRIVERTPFAQSLRDCLVTGPATSQCEPAFATSVTGAAEGERTLRAATVGRWGWVQFQAGKSATWWSLLPDYFRESAAIEKQRASLIPGAS